MRWAWALLCAAALTAAPVELSLKRAVQLAVSPEGNTRVQLSAEALKQAESRSAQSRAALLPDRSAACTDENARRPAGLQLLRAVGLRLDTELVLTDKLQYIPVDALTMEQAKTQALKERPDLEAQQERESSARLSANATKLERLPSVAAFGDYGSSGTGFDNSLPTRTIGISLRVPLFDGGRRDARRAESASQYRAEKVKTNDLKEQIDLDVRLALDALRSAEDQVKVSREGLELAENEMAQARRRNEGGVAIGVEVTDAQSRLERARDNQTAALYNYNVGRIDLAQAMGAVRKSVE